MHDELFYDMLMMDSDDMAPHEKIHNIKMEDEDPF